MRQELWEWTRKHIANGISFGEWLPTEQELTRLALELKLSRSIADENRALLQMFLADKKYCDACQGKMKCYMDGKHRSIIVIDGKISFAHRECRERRSNNG
jgi:hypothetical protein